MWSLETTIQLNKLAAERKVQSLEQLNKVFADVGITFPEPGAPNIKTGILYTPNGKKILG